MSTAYGGGYSRTTYGATGGDDGGGFFGGSQGGSQSARPVNDESLRPVTVKQIIDAEQAFGSDGPFRIDGVDVTQVTFVGMVRQIHQQTTNVTYRLDDGTGTMEVKLWLDADAAGSRKTEAQAQITEEQYVRVWGRLKSFGNKRHVGAHVIKPVADFNEVNYHLLEAAYVHLFFTKGPLGGGGDGAGAGNAGAADNDGMFVGNDGAALLKGASPKAKIVYQYLNQSENSNEGVNMHIIARDTNMSVQDVGAATDELQQLGSIYTTLDDETFAILAF